MTNEIVTRQELNKSQIDLIKRTICPDATNDELALFVQQCNRTGLDPFSRQIYAIKRKTFNRKTKEYEYKMSIETSIDGFRSIAERSEKYAGQTGPYWCGEDEQWVEVWLKPTPPLAAKVAVHRKDFTQPLWSVATWTQYAQMSDEGKPMFMWAKMPALMLAKCAESLALRKAFPQELSGLYTTEEMQQADDHQRIIDAQVEEIADQPKLEVKAITAEPKSGEMTIETASTVVSTDGQKYIDIDSQKLAFMANAIQKKLKKNDEPAQKETRLFKLDAIKTILKTREQSGAQ